MWLASHNSMNMLVLVRVLQRIRTKRIHREIYKRRFIIGTGSRYAFRKLESQKGWWCKSQTESKGLRTREADDQQQENVDISNPFMDSDDSCKEANLPFFPLWFHSSLCELDDAHPHWEKGFALFSH